MVLRQAIGFTQKLPSDQELTRITASVFGKFRNIGVTIVAEEPKKDIYSFIGTFTAQSPNSITGVPTLTSHSN
jgi:hypothetical protein